MEEFSAASEISRPTLSRFLTIPGAFGRLLAKESKRSDIGDYDFCTIRPPTAALPLS
jgi:hypothetical protein